MIFTENDAAMAPGIDTEINGFESVDNLYRTATAGIAPLSDAQAEVSSWVGINRLQIFSAWGGNVIYANGSQQLKLIVVIQVAGARAKAADITQGELDSVRLLDANSGKALPIDIIRDGDAPGWKCMLERQAKFEPFPYAGEVRGPLTTGEHVFLKEFFVSSNTSEPIKLMADITRADGTVFPSNERSLYGSITLSTVSPPAYRKEHYRLKRLSTSRQATEHVAKVDRYILDLVSDQRHIKFVDCSLSAILQARSDNSDYLGYYALGYFNGHKANHWQGTSWETADNYALSNEEPGKVVLLMHFARKGGHSQVRYDRLMARIFVRDMYGNKHELDVAMNAANPSLIEII